jgi:metal-responsive CopG/Arc/MetJ family transcriptional regulator
MKEKERVQFDFTPEALRRLDAIKEKTGATSRAETLRNALRLYEWFINETNPESTVKILDKEGEVVSVFKAMLLYLALESRT